VEFKILGPLEVAHGGERIDIGGPRQQAVLAMLLLAENHVIPIDRLIEAVWDERPPDTARGQIQICISALRRQLRAAEGRERIVSRRPGYMVQVEDGVLDLHVFDAHIAAARQAAQDNNLARAHTEYQVGLSLWRGLALEDISSRLVQQSVDKLHERRLTAVEESIGCELRLGLYNDQIGDLIGWVKEYPLRERFRALLITALYQAGRPAEALEAYQDARDILMEELAIEPGKELQDLQRAILEGAPAHLGVHYPTKPSAPEVTISRELPSVPRLLPAAIPDFTGRSAEAGHLVGRAKESQAEGKENQAVSVNIILGRAGVGKTTLAVHVAHELAPHFPDGQLFARLRSGDFQASLSNILGRFLRALGVPSMTIPGGIEERAEMYRSLLGRRRILIVLDDAMSEQQVDALLPGSPRCLVIVTSRQRLTSLAAANRIELHDFTEHSAVALLTSVVGQARIAAEPEAMAELCRLCGYLPLAIRIVAARLAARPHWSAANLVDRLMDASRRLDELSHGGTGVRESISLTYEALSPNARRLFRMLAVVDAPSFASWAGSPLLRIDVPSAENLLEELTEAYLIDAEQDPVTGATRYRFHEIMRSFACDRVMAEETAQDRHEALERLAGALLFLTGNAHKT
jgi:DNA-binding SARP family transcriptional activator